MINPYHHIKKGKKKDEHMSDVVVKTNVTLFSPFDNNYIY